MKVIGAGLPRTGTSTQQAALNRLGFGPCYHMNEVFEHPDHPDRWIGAFTGKQFDVVTALTGYEATVDAPGCHFWRELLAKYPDAKVILSVRDPHKWFESMTNTVLRQELFRESASADADSLSAARRLAPAMLDTIFGERRDEDHLVEVFNRHNAEVQHEVPADQLLVFEVSQGWQPLCEFLGVDVPDEPFPRLNDSASFMARVRDHQRRLENQD